MTCRFATRHGLISFLSYHTRTLVHCPYGMDQILPGLFRRTPFTTHSTLDSPLNLNRSTSLISSETSLPYRDSIRSSFCLVPCNPVYRPQVLPPRSSTFGNPPHPITASILTSPLPLRIIERCRTKSLVSLRYVLEFVPSVVFPHDSLDV